MRKFILFWNCTIFYSAYRNDWLSSYKSETISFFFESELHSFAFLCFAGTWRLKTWQNCRSCSRTTENMKTKNFSRIMSHFYIGVAFFVSRLWFVCSRPDQGVVLVVLFYHSIKLSIPLLEWLLHYMLFFLETIVLLSRLQKTTGKGRKTNSKKKQLTRYFSTISLPYIFIFLQ